MIRHKEHDELTSIIIGAAIEVHKGLGPGLLESSYHKCLVWELEKKNISVKSEIGVPLIYKDIELEHGYRIDILVENIVVLELKTVDAFTPVHYAQVITYMKLGNYPIGYLLNFHTNLLKEGIKRFVL